jgi:hypothetical protein
VEALLDLLGLDEAGPAPAGGGEQPARPHGGGAGAGAGAVFYDLGAGTGRAVLQAPRFTPDAHPIHA